MRFHERMAASLTRSHLNDYRNEENVKGAIL